MAPDPLGQTRHPLKRPPGAILVVAGATVDAVGLGQTGDTVVKWSVGRHRRVGVAKPDQPAYGIGQPAAGLGHRHVDAVPPGQTPFPQFFPSPPPRLMPSAADLEQGHRFIVDEGVGVGAFYGPATVVGDEHEFGHVKGRTLKGIPEYLHNLLNGYEAVRFNREGKVFPVGVEFEGGRQKIKNPPFPPSGRHAPPVGVDVAELEGLSTLGVPPAHLLG